MILKSVLIVLEARLQQKPPLRYANSTHINDSLSFAEDLALPHYPPVCQDGWPPSITQASHRRQAKNHHCGKSGPSYRHTLLQKYGVCCAKKILPVGSQQWRVVCFYGSRLRLVFASQKQQVKQRPDNLHLSHRRRLYS